MVEQGLLTQDQLLDSLDHQRVAGGKLGAIMVEKGHLSEDKLLGFLSEQCGVKFVKLRDIPNIPSEALEKISETLCRKHVIVPIDIDSDENNRVTLRVASVDPLNVMVFDDIKMQIGVDIETVLSSEVEILEAIDKNYKTESADDALDSIIEASGGSLDEAKGIDIVESGEDEQAAGDDIISLERMGGDSPVITMVNLLLSMAIKAQASDIHIEPEVKRIRIRFRIDGVLHEQKAPPKRFQNALISRIKIMSNLDITEKRLPQDGRIKIKIAKKEYALRVSSLPMAHGEKIVMRILDSSALQVNLNKLGFEPEALSVFNKYIKSPYGINLITGPTGSGKSTTLYSALGILNEPGVNISTVEDPVEFQVPGLNQVQVNSEIGLTFAAGLRSFLRQDPDIIMVGEIRDLETASMAINAALTGHLVFSTLHTNDAPGAVTRLGMMGVEPFLTASSLLMVVAQRLVRRICSACKSSYDVDKDWLIKLGIPEQQMRISEGKVALARGVGCDKCSGTGYKGRQGLYEVLEVTDDIRAMVMEGMNVNKIRERALKQGMISLRICGIRKLLEGVTTVEEMLRVTAD